MANKAIEILKKTEHDLDIEIKMWQKQGRPEVASKCKIEKAQVKQAIEKLCGGENSNDAIALPIHSVSGSDSKDCKSCKHYNNIKTGCKHQNWDNCVERDKSGIVIDYIYYEYNCR